MSNQDREILAWVGRQALAGGVPSQRHELIAALLDAGFAEADVVAALDASSDKAATPADDPRRAAATPMRVAQLSDDATHFLNVLRDLGYLDDAMEDEVLDHVMEEFGSPTDPQEPLRNVELDDLRRHVAAVLFDRQYELDSETIRFLEQEWRVAFH